MKETDTTIDNWFLRPFLPKEIYENATVLPTEFNLEGEGLQQHQPGPFLVVPFVFSPYVMHRYTVPYVANGRKNEQLQMGYVYDDELFCCEFISQDGERVSKLQYGSILFEREHLTPMLRNLFRQADETFRDAKESDAVKECVAHYQQHGVPQKLKKADVGNLLDQCRKSLLPLRKAGRLQFGQ